METEFVIHKIVLIACATLLGSGSEIYAKAPMSIRDYSKYCKANEASCMDQLSGYILGARSVTNVLMQLGKFTLQEKQFFLSCASDNLTTGQVASTVLKKLYDEKYLATLGDMDLEMGVQSAVSEAYPCP